MLDKVSFCLLEGHQNLAFYLGVGLEWGYLELIVEMTEAPSFVFIDYDFIVLGFIVDMSLPELYFKNV